MLVRTKYFTFDGTIGGKIGYPSVVSGGFEYIFEAINITIYIMETESAEKIRGMLYKQITQLAENHPDALANLRPTYSAINAFTLVQYDQDSPLQTLIESRIKVEYLRNVICLLENITTDRRTDVYIAEHITSVLYDPGNSTDYKHGEWIDCFEVCHLRFFSADCVTIMIDDKNNPVGPELSGRSSHVIPPELAKLPLAKYKPFEDRCIFCGFLMWGTGFLMENDIPTCGYCAGKTPAKPIYKYNTGLSAREAICHSPFSAEKKDVLLEILADFRASTYMEKLKIYHIGRKYLGITTIAEKALCYGLAQYLEKTNRTLVNIY